MYRYIAIILFVLNLGGCAVSQQLAEPKDNNQVNQSKEDKSNEEMEGAETTTEDSTEETLEAQAPKAEYKKITPEEAKELMVEGNIILDVRTKEEYDQGHIEGAMLLPVSDILDGKLDSLPDKNQIILVYCRSGNRSATASKYLVKVGYTNVYDFGGIKDWPYEVVQ